MATKLLGTGTVSGVDPRLEADVCHALRDMLRGANCPDGGILIAINDDGTLWAISAIDPEAGITPAQLLRFVLDHVEPMQGPAQ